MEQNSSSKQIVRFSNCIFFFEEKKPHLKSDEQLNNNDHAAFSWKTESVKNMAIRGYQQIYVDEKAMKQMEFYIIMSLTQQLLQYYATEFSRLWDLI